MIKKENDFVLGILTLIFSGFLFFGKLTKNVPEYSQGGLFARADVWIRMIAVMLAVVAVLLVISSLNFTAKKEEKDPFHFVLDGTMICTAGALICYALLFPVLGFEMTTFLEIIFLTGLYTLKEEGKAIRDINRQEWIRIGKKSVITAAVMLIVLWLIFGKLLAVQLP